jgi:hypothetical protein
MIRRASVIFWMAAIFAVPAQPVFADETWVQRSDAEASLKFRVQRGDDTARLLTRRTLSPRTSSWIDAVIVIPKEAADIGWTLHPIRRKNGDHRLELIVGGPRPIPISELNPYLPELDRLHLEPHRVWCRDRVIAVVYLPVAARASVSERGQALELSVELPRDQEVNDWPGLSRSRMR